MTVSLSSFVRVYVPFLSSLVFSKSVVDFEWQGYFKGVFRKFQGCFKGVLRKFQGCFKEL